MAQTVIEKTLPGSLVDCHIHVEEILGGMFTRETRTTYTTPFHPWQNYRRRTSRSYGFNFRIPQALSYLFRMDTQYVALVLFVGLAAF
jgi:hypothetical protein